MQQRVPVLDCLCVSVSVLCFGEFGALNTYCCIVLYSTFILDT